MQRISRNSSSGFPRRAAGVRFSRTRRRNSTRRSWRSWMICITNTCSRILLPTIGRTENGTRSPWWREGVSIGFERVKVIGSGQRHDPRAASEDLMKALAAALALVATTAVWAQNAPAPGPAQQPQTFKSSVDLVPVDVNVVDHNGRPIADLTAQDFSLKVDGKPRKIASAQFIAVTRDDDRTPITRRLQLEPGLRRRAADHAGGRPREHRRFARQVRD